MGKVTGYGLLKAVVNIPLPSITITGFLTIFSLSTFSLFISLFDFTANAPYYFAGKNN